MGHVIVVDAVQDLTRDVGSTVATTSDVDGSPVASCRRIT